MTNKKRWQKLAGIKAETETKSESKPLNEGFTNFGMATPGVLGNPFEGRMSSVVAEQDGIFGGPEEQLAMAAELLRQVVREAREHATHVELEGTDVISEELVRKIKYFLKDENLEESKLAEAQFAKDALEDIDTMYQPDPGEDYEPNPRTPKFTGAILDDDDFAERGVEFSPEDEGLSVRSVDDELDPEYDEDDLGHLFSDRVWPDAVDGTKRGGGKS